MLSGAASTSMIGNLIQGQLGTPGLEARKRGVSMIACSVLLVQIDLYVVATNREAAR